MHRTIEDDTHDRAADGDVGHREQVRAATLPLERLEAEITTLAADIWAATCRWFLLIAELDRREGWKSWGAKSCADWLSWKCGVSPATAREHVRVAGTLRDLPEIRAAFARGELSYSKVRALTRVADAESEVELVGLAREATAAQLERILRAYRRTTPGEAAQRHDRRFLRLTWDADGSLEIRGRLSPDDGALLLEALESARDTQRGDDVSAETRDTTEEPHGAAENVSADEVTATRSERRGRSFADALVVLAETTLATSPTPSPGGERHQVVLHVDEQSLSAQANESPPGRCEVENGPTLAAVEARRMACDAAVVGMTESHGTPLGVGRRRRTVPVGLRRALNSRDGGCRFPGCTQRKFVDAHHVRHWAHGGATDLENLVLICRHHHRVVHEGGYVLEFRMGRRVDVYRPDGTVVPQAPAPVVSTRDLAELNGERAVAATERTCVARSENEGFDLGLTIDALVSRFGPAGPAGPRPRSAAVSAERVAAGVEPEGPAEPKAREGPVARRG